MSKEIANNTQYRIDSRVINLFILIGIVAVGILSYQFYTYKPQSNVDFVVLGDHPKVNEMIKFENKTYGKHVFRWDFGDSSKISVRRSPVHIYKNSGEYQVCLMVDNQYEKNVTVNVIDEFVVAPKNVMPRIIGPTTVYANKKITLTCPTANVSSYAWYVGDQRAPLGFRKQFSYVFKKPGYKNVVLVVNGESRYSVKKSIYVKQRKNTKVKDIVKEIEEDTVEEVFIPEKPDLYSRIDELKAKEEDVWILPPDSKLQVELVNILSNDGDQNDFVKYLSNGADYKMVMANQNYITFSELVKELKGNEFVIKEFSTLRNRNRITKLTLRYRIKRRFL